MSEGRIAAHAVRFRTRLRCHRTSDPGTASFLNPLRNRIGAPASGTASFWIKFKDCLLL
jgi:hypothetical protein